MPPLGRRRRGRPASASAAAPYRRRCQRADRQDREIDAGGGTSRLPDDALASVFARSHHVADVVRCSAACRRWARVVAASSAVIANALPPAGRFLPRAALGIFHQDKDAPTARTRGPLRFVPDPAASPDPRLAQRQWPPPQFTRSRPVASRDGLLVLELQPDCHRDGLRLVVCNPITGREVTLPALCGRDKLRDYGCAVITGHDQDPPRSPAHLRVLLVYSRRGLAALRCYSSDTGRWGAEAETGFKVSGRKLRLSQAVVLRGAAFWPLDHGALGVRLAGPESSTMEPHLLPYCAPHRWPEKRLLGVSPENRRLFFIYFGVGDDILVAKISYFAMDGDGISSGRQEGSRLEEAVPMHQMKMTRADPHVQDTLKLRWFGDRSGLVLFTLGQGSGHNGMFALNLETRMVDKVADGEYDSWKNIVGYEMDMAA